MHWTTIFLCVAGGAFGGGIWSRTPWSRIKTNITKRDLVAAPVVYIDGFPARLVGYTTDYEHNWTLEFMSDAEFRRRYTKGT